MLKTFLKTASVIQIISFVVLALVEVNLIALLVLNNLTVDWLKIGIVTLALAMYLSLAKFYWNANIILTSNMNSQSDREKFKLWGILSISLCGLVNLCDLIVERRTPKIPEVDPSHFDFYGRILYELNSLRPFFYKVSYLFSSTPNLFMICLLYVIISGSLRSPKAN